ncbi:MAG: hypothetical protein GXY44_01840 [Phycisphaerales bacterium]|nr:hypothetical protein [Phycisphaerales bacterium]
MSAENIQPNYPRKWESHIEELAAVFEIEVASLRSRIMVTPAQLRKVYLPLLAWLEKISRASHHRLLVGLAGIPGSGKSTFAAIVGLLADRLLAPGALVCVGMDGWHWPSAVLQQRTTCNPDGRIVPLSQRKGGPESFEVAALAAALRELKNARAAVHLPVYDRRLHEPIPDGLNVPPETRIVLLEGNYVLYPTPPWDQVFEQLHPRLMLIADPAVARQRVIARHIRGGMNPDQAEEKFAQNDRYNTDVVQGTAIHGDQLIDLT